MNEKKMKKKSISKKVVMSAIILALLSILGILANKSAMDIEYDYVGVYNKYVALESARQGMQAAYIEASTSISLIDQTDI